MDSLLFSLQSVVPLFLEILVGYLLRKKNVITDQFVSIGTKIVFNIALPVLLFTQIAEADLTTLFNPKLVVYALSATLVIIFLLWLIVPRLVDGKDTQGALIQGIYRGNFAILGVPLAINMFGQQEAAATSLLLPFTVPLYNAMAVVILTVFAANENGEKQKVSVKKIVKGIVTNPLIIGILLGLPFSIFRIQIPTFAAKCLSPFSSLSTPLALICLGGQFTMASFKGNMKLTLIATFVKEFVISTLAILGGILLGFRGGELGAIFITFMAPSAVSSYVMAKNMHSNSELAGQLVISTTLVSCLTLFLGIFILRSLSLI